jgi:hypothetical protein
MQLFFFFLLLTMVAAQNSIRGLVDRQLVSAVLLSLFRIDFIAVLLLWFRIALHAEPLHLISFQPILPLYLLAVQQ